FRDAVRAVGRGGFERRTSVGWSVHDLVAHVAAWEAHAAGRLRAYRESGTPPPFVGEVDALNAQFVASHRLVGAEALLDELDAAHRRLADELALLDEAAIAAHDGWVGKVIAANTFEHFAEHLRELEEATRR
ncbi:MAG: ClbS/DfsB family four-helix bundle protein, partial [Chloroflexi bacterium]|nr:ClbS/DfsB family four-helix bundle protein [Chloroflexota bacterium]